MAKLDDGDQQTHWDASPMKLQNMDDQRACRVTELLEDAVNDELRAASGMGQFELSDDQIEQLTAAVTSRLLSAFSFDWCPHWVKPGAVHTWPSAGGYRARCGACLADSPAYPEQEPAVQWAHDHQASHER